MRLRVMAERLLKAQDVAQRIGMRTEYVYRLCREKRIPHIRLGRSVRFRAESLERWMREEEQAIGRRSG
jgi:excisionase family DNA binding protein